MNGAPRFNTATTVHEQMLVELSQWLARVQQYGVSHPACARLGEKTHAALSKSLAAESPLSFAISREGLSIGDLPITHPAAKQRIAPKLHERGVITLRFLLGVTLEELKALVELLTLPPSTTFDRGGLKRLVQERGLARIIVEELVHDITSEEREGQRKRGELRTFFGDQLRALLLQRGFAGLLGEKLLELLDHPEIAVTILEEDPTGICEAFAGLCLMVRNEQERMGKELAPKLHAILARLSPASHDRILLGLPALVAEFRQALAWTIDGAPDEELARIALPSFRSHGAELDVVFYALSVALPHKGRRISVLRRVALHFYDLPADDANDNDLLRSLAKPAPEFDSNWRERDVLARDAARALAKRTTFITGAVAADAEVVPLAEPVLPPFDGRRVTSELMSMAARTRRFEQLCAKLPLVTATLARGGSTDAVVGILRSLHVLTRTEHRDLVVRTLRTAVTYPVALQLLSDLEATSANLEGEAFEDLAGTIRLLVSLNPQAALDRLEESQSRKVRRLLVEVLAAAGASLLPLVKAKLESQQWFVVRNAVVLVPRVGGSPRDLHRVSRHPNERVRLEVIRAVRVMPFDETSMEIVASYLSDPSEEVQKPARVMIHHELLNANSIAALERVAEDEKQPEVIRNRVVEALGRCPLDAAATALYSLLQPRGLLELGSIRDLVAVGLRSSRAPNAPALFAEGLRSSAWRVRKACERAAGGGA